MNDAEFEAQKARIQTLEARWIETLGLRAWSISTDFVRSDFASDGEPAPGTLATASTQSQYMRATISWNMTNVGDNSDRELEYAFLHELMHVFVNEMRPWRPGTDVDKALSQEESWHEERVCTMLGWALLWTREASRKYQPVEGEY